MLGRDSILMQVKERLFAANVPSVIALAGLPGIGKTALAAALATDQQVQLHFRDGILWAKLGPRPNVLGQLARWGQLLGVNPSQVENIKSREAWSRALQAAIGTRQILLIIDDARTAEDALALQIGGPRCVHLLTTCLSQAVLAFALQESIVVPQLYEVDSLALLARFVPALVEQDPQGAQALVRAVGGLPLALTLMGKYLASQPFTDQPSFLHNAVVKFYDTEQRLGVSLSTPSAQLSTSLATTIPLNLHTAIALCDQHLSPQAYAALRALTVFPPQPESFSQEAALAASQQPEEALDMLLDVGLLETCGPGRYTLHQAVADYVRIHSDALVTQQQLTSSLVGDLQKFQRNASLLADHLSSPRSLLNISPGPMGSMSKLQSCKHIFSYPLRSLPIILLTVLLIAVIVLAANKQLDLGRTLPASNQGSTSIAAKADPYPPFSGKLALDDPLSNNSKGYGWEEHPSRRSRDYACQFIDGAYHVSLRSRGYVPCHTALHASNFTFEVQMQIIKGNCGGLSLRDTTELAHAYSFNVCKNGSYQFYRYDSFSSGQMLHSGSSSAIVTGLSQSNVIAVVANGSAFDLYINHHQVASVHDSSYSQGQFGVSAHSKTEVAYRNAKMWIL